MSTRYNLPLSSLPEEFFVEELRYRDKKNRGTISYPKTQNRGSHRPPLPKRLHPHR